MKQVMVQAFCDLHEDDEQVPAIAEDTYDGRLLDLCATHLERVQRAKRVLHDLFAQGVSVDAPVARPRKGMGGRKPKELTGSLEWRTCPDCGYECPTRSALGQHTKQHHRKRLADYDWPT